MGRRQTRVQLDEARQVSRDASAPYARQVEIAASKYSELSDLIRCLRLGGLPAETAATAPYTRTGRPYSGKITEFSTDADEWAQYLARQLQLAAS